MKRETTQSRILSEYVNFKNAMSACSANMTKLTEQLTSLNCAPFDSHLAFETPTRCVDALVAHRIVSKFHVVDKTRSEELRLNAFENYKLYEDEVLTNTHEGFNLWCSGRTGYVLRKAREFLHDIFKNYHVDLKHASLEYTSGESYISSGGEVSLTAKLADRDHWTTTWSCLEDTVFLVYHNSSLKRIARNHVGFVDRETRRKLYDEYRHSNDVGYAVFRRLLIDHVLVFVDGARGTSVPKDNNKDRFINVEATFPMILQRLVARSIRCVLAANGNDLGSTFSEKFTTGKVGSPRHEAQKLQAVRPEKENFFPDAQAVHIDLIKSRDFSTIDFSNASDSVLWKVVCALFPKEIRDDLMKYRSSIVTLGDSIVEPLKLSSMGNGFTFEVMTSMLFAIGYMFSDRTRVYGDDVIIPNQSAHEFIDVCAYIGFSTNMSKTFINSPMRESCGGFYHDAIGYLTSYAFGPIESFQDVLITCNKLTIILEANQVSKEVRFALEETRDAIKSDIPASRKGPIPSCSAMKDQNMAYYCYDEDWGRKHKKSGKCRNNFQLTLKRFHSVFSSYQVQTNDIAVVFVPVYVPNISKKVRFEEATYAAFLYAGRNSKVTVRGRGKWVDKPAVVNSHGYLHFLSELTYVRRQLRSLSLAIIKRDEVYTNTHFW